MIYLIHPQIIRKHIIFYLFFKVQMSFICHIHNYTEYNEQWNVFSAFNPSKLEQWAADCAASGEQSGVRCLAQGSHLSRGHFLLEPGFEPTTLGYFGFQVQRSIHYYPTRGSSAVPTDITTIRASLVRAQYHCACVK